MPTYVITAPNGKTLEVKGDHVPTEGELKDIFKAAGVDAETAPSAQSSPKPSDIGGGAMAGAGAAVPAVATAAEEVATNPNIPRAVASIGRVSGAVEGAMKAGPLGIGPGSWAGGKAGWFTGKVAQAAAGPVANVLTKVAPYAQTLSTLGGAQGVNDLAQMAEPNRGDIGFLGLAGTSGNAQQQAAVMGAQIRALQQQGMSPAEAARTVYNAWAASLKGSK